MLALTGPGRCAPLPLKGLLGSLPVSDSGSPSVSAHSAALSGAQWGQSGCAGWMSCGISLNLSSVARVAAFQEAKSSSWYRKSGTAAPAKTDYAACVRLCWASVPMYRDQSTHVIHQEQASSQVIKVAKQATEAKNWNSVALYIPMPLL